MIWYVFCFLLILIGIRIYHINTYNDCLSLEQTLPIRGILSILIILHHLAQRFHLNFLGYPILQNIGFLLVGLFFFYSGYGLVYSFLHKKNYMKSFISKRVFSLYIPLVLVSFLTILFQIGMGEKVSLIVAFREILSIRLVNGIYWYMWVLLLFYTVFYILFSSFEKKRAITLYTIFLFLFTFFLATYKVEGFWYFSTPAFILGTWVGYKKEEVIAFLKKHYVFALPNISILVLLCMMYVLGIKIPYTSEKLWYTVYLSFPVFISFFLLILLLKVRIGNKLLNMFGKYSLEMYLLHPLVIKFADFIPIKNENIFILFTLVITFFSSYLFHYIQKGICKKFTN